jgi:hypothetical protein
MVSITEFRSDTRSINDGDWVRVDAARYGDLEIFSRGFTDEFVDAQNNRTGKAAEAYVGDKTRIPNSELRKINASLLEDFLILDVRNLTDDAGIAVTVDTFHSMLYEPQYSRLARASWEAAARISTRSMAQLDAARGNSPQPSVSHSNGATSAPN